MGVSSATVVSESRKASKQVHSSAAPRLKREDHCLPTALDNLFSPWKVLVGPNDWKNHSSGVEGAERYKLHNLPSSYFGPGVYELALHLDRCNHGNDTKKDASRFLKNDTIVVVYVGQAENVRTRLQHYGRCGSHLEGGIDLLKSVKSHNCEIPSLTVLQTKPGDLDRTGDSLSTLEEDSCCCPLLFTKAFCQGYSIAFRWTAAGSKGDAAAIETGLLKFFDYAWNRGSNGKRRPSDAFRKSQQQFQSSIDSTKGRSWYRPSKWTIRLPKIGASKVRNLREKRTVVSVFKERLWKVNNLARRLSVPEEKSDVYFDLLSLPWKSQVKEEKSLSSSSHACVTNYINGSVMRPSNTIMCGVIDANGIACTVTPMQGRKRCEAHKGMRLLCTSRTVKATMAKKHLVSVHACNNDGTKNVIHESSQLLVCGYLLKDGSKCRVLPEKGRKRCLSHKGRRIKMQ